MPPPARHRSRLLNRDENSLLPTLQQAHRARDRWRALPRLHLDQEMIYQCRATKPWPSRWLEVEADDPAQAVMDFQETNVDWLPRVAFKDGPEDNHYHIYFTRVEVANHGVYVARTYHYGIYRHGGVPSETREQRLLKVADAMGWEGNPEELLEEGWNKEETAQDFWRKHGA